ncbi:MAG: MoaD/ThiS family protein [Verrucomicrobia bacterium]|nr:MoaD/ThiS family protein [Verrucomicrobiota bacterium]
MIRVLLPYHLRTLARVEGEVLLEVKSPATLNAVLDALETCYPVLRGTIRDQTTWRRRPFVRFFACKEDLSHHPPNAALPDTIALGEEPFLIIGAMAGG